MGAHTFPDRIKIPLPVNVARLQADLDTLEREDWIPQFVTHRYEGLWDNLPLRAPAGETHPIRMTYSDPTCTDWVDTPYLKSCAYLPELLASFPFPLSCVRIMSLFPGSHIKPHRDHDLAFKDGAVRIHIPIRTHPDVVFTLNDNVVPMHTGECWYLRLSDTHSVTNFSPVRRVHLVIDAQTCPDLEAFLQAGLQTQSHDYIKNNPAKAGLAI